MMKEKGFSEIGDERHLNFYPCRKSLKQSPLKFTSIVTKFFLHNFAEKFAIRCIFKSKEKYKINIYNTKTCMCKKRK